MDSIMREIQEEMIATARIKRPMTEIEKLRADLSSSRAECERLRDAIALVLEGFNTDSRTVVILRKALEEK